jgi:hypothetical protein
VTARRISKFSVSLRYDRDRETQVSKRDNILGLRVRAKRAVQHNHLTKSPGRDWAGIAS